jgi:hypothetical protein
VKIKREENVEKSNEENLKNELENWKGIPYCSIDNWRITNIFIHYNVLLML